MSGPLYIKGHTMHARRGSVRHRFSYAVDYVLIDPEDMSGQPALFSRNRFNMFSVCDTQYGALGATKQAAAWAREVLDGAGIPDGYRLQLLTKPRVLGRTFNPVSFWLAKRGDDLLAVIAEVNNTFGDRHSYLCHQPDFASISPRHMMQARKLMHVSPFQELRGEYNFKFNMQPDKIDIIILQKNGDEGVTATLSGPALPLTNRRILGALLRRPFGTFRTITLIYWQALRLKIKGATYRRRPEPPQQEVSTCSLPQND